MTKKNHASLRISSGHYRIADLVIGVAFAISAIIGAYFAVAHEVRDYWLLVVVGIVGAVLMLRRSREVS